MVERCYGNSDFVSQVLVLRTSPPILWVIDYCLYIWVGLAFGLVHGIRSVMVESGYELPVTTAFFPRRVMRMK